MSEKKILDELKDEYPSNSKVEKKKEATKVNVVVARKSKPPMMRRMLSSLVDDDVESVSAYIIQDVLIPAAKTTISDMVSGGIEMLLFGGTKSPRNMRGGMKSTISYNNPSIRNRESNVERRNRSSHRFDDVVMDTRADAEIVRESMQNILEEYDQVTVADFYDLAGITSRFTDQNWGWTALPRVQIVRQRRGGGYILNLPKPEEL